MNYSDYTRATWHHVALDNAVHDYSVLVHYATLAASSHNTQPWIFRLEENQIRILPDLSRRCPAVDPDDHHLYASLGCATENLIVAAQAAGLSSHVSFDASTSGVHINLVEATPSRSSLFDAIPRRRCNRSEYDGLPLTADELQQLTDAGRGDGVSGLMITDPENKELTAHYVAKGNIAQFSDPAWTRELKSWIRFNTKEALRSGDGLYGPATGNPNVPRWLGLLVMRARFNAKNQNTKDLSHIRSSSAIAVLYSEADDIPHWIEAGRCYQRLALRATALGLSTAFINQPAEVPELRPEFARSIGIGDRRPDLVVRIGRGAEMPHSPRRPVADVIK